MPIQTFSLNQVLTFAFTDLTEPVDVYNWWKDAVEEAQPKAAPRRPSTSQPRRQSGYASGGDADSDDDD